MGETFVTDPFDPPEVRRAKLRARLAGKRVEAVTEELRQLEEQLAHADDRQRSRLEHQVAQKREWLEALRSDHESREAYTPVRRRRWL